MADGPGDDTVFASLPPVLQSVMATIFAPIGRLLRYRSNYPEYLDEPFWEAHVEHPPDQ